MEFLEGDDVLEQINWDNLLDGLPDSDSIFELEPPLTTDLQLINDSSNSSSPATVSSWIGEVETLLMKDDDDKVDQLENCNAFLADILVGSPSAHESGGEVLDASTDKDSTSSDDADGGPKEKDGGAEEKNNNDEEEDPDDIVSKKRRRQLRNKDAAVRSRERKKLYVRDLEIKSRYMEGECRRLDRLLQCFIAENHALRLSLQRGNAFGVTSAKQESAVLLLESLLLGSLLWLLGIMCLFPQPAMPQSTMVEVLLETMEKKAPENVAQRGAGSKIFISLANSRRCKASRPRMKLTGVIFPSLNLVL
ncbi:bZIP transcription factor 60 [Populus alba]|uniref:BZIP transcription factor family protein n=2 Tax=Populus TaxID=3689 RepID=A0A4V6A8I4_POPAL|nr:bZIP transcription factor 60 [Populus alba]KAJ6999080.1 bZIP transcription factor 60 [Populus alba x Populus x berolinensis]TKS03106.1 bZIP transcription factor family protein [Populus alba]